MPTTLARRLILTATLLAVLGAAGCSTDPAPPVADADVVGSWGTSTTEGQTSLVLDEDGTAVGNDGCTTLNGTWRAGGKGVSFSAWELAEADCPAAEAWLAVAVGARLEDGDLLFVDADNRAVGSMQPTH